MSEAKKTAGCGKMLEGAERYQIPCGQPDNFGVQQFCHSCNAGIYYGTHKRPASPEVTP